MDLRKRTNEYFGGGGGVEQTICVAEWEEVIEASLIKNQIEINDN